MIMLNLPPQLEEAVISMAQLQNMRTEEYIIDCLQKNIPIDDVPFNYDLERMKQAVESPSVLVPDFETDEEFLTWINRLEKADFKENV